MADRYDERDTMFSRIYELKEGSNNYIDYYRRNPDKEEDDRKFRDASGGVFADRLIEQRQIDAVFSLIEDLRPLAGHAADDGSTDTGTDTLLEISPDEASSRIKKIVSSYGVLSCGIAETDYDWVYSVRGRGAHYGNIVDGVLPYTIVFAVEMDEAEINRAPAVEESLEVVQGYLKAGIAGLALKRIINAWGYRAVCHIDGMSQIVLPPAAEAAGIGSIGLHGVLVTKECGPRIRLAAVTTDMPLSLDTSSGFNVSKFCRTCGKCADSCPSESIRKISEYKKGDRFSINHESCFGLWKDMATDCGVCLAVCPFSHPRRASAINRNSEKGRDKKQNPEFLKEFMFGREY